MKNKYLALAFIVFAVVSCDQWTKSMAVDYLRRPERYDVMVPCENQRKQCEQQCASRVRVLGNFSVLACQRECSVEEQICQHRYERDHELATIFWQQRQKQMERSWLCRKIEYAGTSRPECVVWNKYFHFTYRINRGAAWGILSDLPAQVRRPFFMTITSIAILFILFLFSFRLEQEHKIMVIALSLILGGALGNFLDRVRLDYVVDFIEWFWRDRRYTFPTFNIADTAISCGVGLIAIELFFFAPADLEGSSEPNAFSVATNIATENMATENVATEHVENVAEVSSVDGSVAGEVVLASESGGVSSATDGEESGTVAASESGKEQT